MNYNSVYMCNIKFFLTEKLNTPLNIIGQPNFLQIHLEQFQIFAFSKAGQ